MALLSPAGPIQQTTAVLEAFAREQEQAEGDELERARLLHQLRELEAKVPGLPRWAPAFEREAHR